MTSNQNKGFSLVELAIVLVVIGMIVAAIAGGAHLMQAAKMDKLITELTGYKQAVETFRLKYHAWPGDMPDAESYWGTYNAGTNVEGTVNGNGNEQVEAPNETQRAWQQLTRSEIIAGHYAGTGGYVAGTTVPGTGWDKKPYYVITYATVYQQSGNLLSLTTTSTGSTPDDEAITPADAYTIDVKSDDGAADSGLLYAVRASSVGTTAGKCVNGAVTDAAAAYIQTDASVSCRLFLWLDRE